MGLRNNVSLGGINRKIQDSLCSSRVSQDYGLGYDEMFSPVAKITIIQVPLVLVVNKDWKLWQMDMKNVFLNDELNREFLI